MAVGVKPADRGACSVAGPLFQTTTFFVRYYEVWSGSNVSAKADFRAASSKHLEPDAPEPRSTETR